MKLILLWHFHQPYYGSPDLPRFELPWVRLHAAKSYLDMATVLEAHPDVRVVANFSGALLEQLLQYLNDGWRDWVWEITLRRAEELSEGERRYILRHFFSLDRTQTMSRFPRYLELAEKVDGAGPDQADVLSPPELTDLQVLFNLAWCGFTLRERDPRIKALIEKGQGFDEDDKKTVLDVHIDAVAMTLEAWKNLAQSGQAEVTISPHYHPILPLLIDSDSARRALPNAPLPTRFSHPKDAEHQIEWALDLAETIFGTRPVGMWPSEGSVSPELIPLVASKGVKWMASDEDVLLKSIRTDPSGRQDIYSPWTFKDWPLQMFFRHHELSDRVGFSYARTSAPEAAEDFRRRLREVRASLAEDAECCVTVALDGENAWQYYPDDGRDFLNELYSSLSEDDVIETVTPRQYLSQRQQDVSLVDREIQQLHSGSWISANFRVWIGQSPNNRAWEHLVVARRELEEAKKVAKTDSAKKAIETATRFLFRAEGSDWMWWYGEDFASPQDLIFDRLFRTNVIAMYRALGLEPPVKLSSPIGLPPRTADVSLPKRLIHPKINGRYRGYLGWAGAGMYTPDGPMGAMARGVSDFERLVFGFDLDNLYLRLEARSGEPPSEEHPLTVEALVVFGDEAQSRRMMVLTIRGPELVEGKTFEITQSKKRRFVSNIQSIAYVKVLEVAIPLADLGLSGASCFSLSLRLIYRGVELDRVPPSGSIELTVPDDAFDRRHWVL